MTAYRYILLVDPSRILKRENVKAAPVKSLDGRGWGLQANQDIAKVTKLLPNLLYSYIYMFNDFLAIWLKLYFYLEKEIYFIGNFIINPLVSQLITSFLILA